MLLKETAIKHVLPDHGCVGNSAGSDRFVFIDTPIGTMAAVASQSALFALFFVDEDRIDEWTEQFSSTAVLGANHVLDLIQKELELYFGGTLQVFTVPIDCVASTQFFADVLRCVQEIPYGVIKSYKQVAQEAGNAKAYRAVGAASKSNNLLIVIPCHRVVGADGSLGGYSQGINRKSWLLGHEQSFSNQ